LIGQLRSLPDGDLTGGVIELLEALEENPELKPERAMLEATRGILAERIVKNLSGQIEYGQMAYNNMVTQTADLALGRLTELTLFCTPH